jgi:2-methylfumaryl-CoA hydratase
MTSEHIHLTAVLDNTSQVHCNQFMIDQDPERYVGGQLIVFGGIPFTLCLGLSSPDVGDNALGDIAYPTGRHTAPLFAGDTVFAATEIRAVRDYPGRPDLGVVEAVLFGHKFARQASRSEPKASEDQKGGGGPAGADAPAGWKKVPIFELERRIAMKRRSHYG